MILDFLPEKILTSISKIDINNLYEIRLRENFPIKVNFKFNNYYLTNTGVDIINDNAIICGLCDIKYIIRKLTDYSIYAHNDRIKSGYLVTNDGVRVGLSGEYVFDNGQVLTMKNVTSLLIRIPHFVKDCSKSIFNKIFINGEILNTLICSPPFFGKTTILKDLSIKINDNTNNSILIIDERNEFCSIVGENIDKIKFATKKLGFINGIRAMSPTVIITDELVEESDFEFVKFSSNFGVKIIASCHAKSVNDLKNRSNFKTGIFERYVFLTPNGQPGQVSRIYDKNFIEL